MRRAVIGITSDYSDGYDDTYPNLLTYKIKSTYVKAVINAGGIPLLLPFSQEIDTGELLKRVDGIIISGSRDDIHPYFIYQKRRPPKQNYIKRLEFEFRIASEAIERGIPLFGICGGMQLINVLFGGTLISDIPALLGSKIHRKKYFALAHRVWIHKKSHLYKAIGRTTISVNSTHHQAVYNIPSCFEVTAIAEDGIVEAIEMDSTSFVMGVQFHPEALIKYKAHLQIFKYFIQEARSR